MKRRDLLDQMIEAACRIFDRVELSTGDFRGGTCRIRDEKCLFLNKNAGFDNNIRIVATKLAENGADSIFLLPKIREAVDQYGDV
ncbi:MAG: hypothetical protein P9L92_11445 [Candidatus Electryonea clarkiae]|nr:hypothetical protein [Candidatus Electryonea clarkiae]MDP8286984.1 hypothetical protein [Candidatus Electryonea clarkiae]